MNATSSQMYHQLMDEGSAAAWEKQWEQAARAYRQALAEQPDDLIALTSLGMVLQEVGDYAGALQAYQRAQAVDPNDPLHPARTAQVYEQQGDTRRAAQSALQAAELQLKLREPSKAIENFRQALSYEPESPNARARLALVYEKAGLRQDAVAEYIALASILQRAGQSDKARQAVARAQQLLPDSTLASHAMESLQRGDLLPRPKAPDAARIEAPAPPEPGHPNPLQEAVDEAVTELAELLFKYRQEEKLVPQQPARRGIKLFNSGAARQAVEQADQSRMYQHLEQVIDLKTRGEFSAAAEELERSVEKGLQHPAGAFYLAYLLRESDPQKALRHAQRATLSPDFALGAQLLIGQIHYKNLRYSEAAQAFLQALQLADLATAPPEHEEALKQAYEPLIESVIRRTGAGDWKNVCNLITEQVLRRDWRRRLEIARSRTESSAGTGPAPAAESILNAHSSQVIEALQAVRKLAEEGKLRTATEEAFYALQYAPTYLPLHVEIAELLLLQSQTKAASEKLLLTARLYSLRGDHAAASRLFERVVNLNPMDIKLRRSLIELLTANGRTHEAIEQYIALAELHYRLAELDNARQTYLDALKIAQPASAEAVNLLRRVADIDMQRLDYRLALGIYEQLQAALPADTETRHRLVDLNFRLGQETTAFAQVDSYLSLLETSGKPGSAAFLEGLLAERPDSLELRRRLVDVYRRGGKNAQAVEHLQVMASQLEEAGKPDAARKMIEAILLLDPPNRGRFEADLERLG